MTDLININFNFEKLQELINIISYITENNYDGDIKYENLGYMLVKIKLELEKLSFYVFQNRDTCEIWKNIENIYNDIYDNYITDKYKVLLKTSKKKRKYVEENENTSNKKLKFCNVLQEFKNLENQYNNSFNNVKMEED